MFTVLGPASAPTNTYPQNENGDQPEGMVAVFRRPARLPLDTLLRHGIFV